MNNLKERQIETAMKTKAEVVDNINDYNRLINNTIIVLEVESIDNLSKQILEEEMQEARDKLPEAEALLVEINERIKELTDNK